MEDALHPHKVSGANYSSNTQIRMIELLEAIDWKLWMLYNMSIKGEVKFTQESDQKIKNLNEVPKDMNRGKRTDNE